MFLNAMYGGLGQSLGAIVGGKLQSKVGTVKTFVYSGIFDLCFVGFVILYLNFRKDSSFRDPKPILPREEEPIAVPAAEVKASVEQQTFPPTHTQRSSSTAIAPPKEETLNVPPQRLSSEQPPEPSAHPQSLPNTQNRTVDRMNAR